MKPNDRSERLLALLLIEQMKGSRQRDRVAKLNLAGFSNVEIADILQITSAQVARELYDARQAPAKKKAAKKKTAGPASPQG
jgi:DNA-directed RNA polymerase specialized sigma24 family protein